jgi:hypothetical protein
VDKALTDKYKENLHRLAEWWIHADMVVERTGRFEFLPFQNKGDSNGGGIVLYPSQGRPPVGISAETVAHADFNEAESSVTFPTVKPIVLEFRLVRSRKLFDAPPRIVAVVRENLLAHVFADGALLDAKVLAVEAGEGYGRYMGGTFDMGPVHIQPNDAMPEDVREAVCEYDSETENSL